MGDPDRTQPDSVDATVGRAADDLYGGSPDDFVRVRGERVKEARAAGDRAAATAIGALRRPTRSAWTVNLLAREAPDELGALLDLGEALRAAQESLSGADLRRLSGERHRAVEALVRRAIGLADGFGAKPTEAIRREVGQTLQIALADPEVAAQVRSGRLAAVPEYGGFGPFATTVAAADAGSTPTAERTTDPGGTRPHDPVPDRAGDEAAVAERAERQARIARARTALQAAETATGAAEQSLEDAQAEAQAAADELAGLRDQLDRAERKASACDEAVSRARDAIDRLRTEQDDARTALEAAES